MSGTHEEHWYQALMWSVSSVRLTDWSQGGWSAVVRHCWAWAWIWDMVIEENMSNEKNAKKMNGIVDFIILILDIWNK